MPYTAVIEMTALVDRKYFGGQSLVYLPKYVASDSFDLHLTDEQVKERFLGGLEQMYPSFRRSHVLCFQISRVKYLLPIPTLNYSEDLPSVSTSISGVHIVNSAHIVNGTLNVNETVQLAESVARAIRDCRHPKSCPILNMKSEKTIASLSLDLDNKWSYLKTHGDPGWESFPSYLDTLVPRVLQFLSQRNLKITFFVVGQDAALEKNHTALKAIAAAGHEIGNHSFSHEPWFHSGRRWAPDRGRNRGRRRAHFKDCREESRSVFAGLDSPSPMYD